MPKAKHSRPDGELYAVDRAEPIQYWKERFGVPESHFAPYHFFRRNKGAIWLADKSAVTLDGISCEAVGLAFLRHTGRFLKPTHSAVLLLGTLATRNVLQLPDALAWRFIARESFPWPKESVPEGGTHSEILTPGYVIVRHQQLAVGCGLWLNDTLTSQIPKGRKLSRNAPPFYPQANAVTKA